jgi:hypothetical protein
MERKELLMHRIPASFYERILNDRALALISISGHRSVRDLILQQALEHLDPTQEGLSITLAICVPPRLGQKVRSLREVGCLATPAWPRNLAGRSMFFGYESLVGYVTSHVRSSVITCRDKTNPWVRHWTNHERSAAACPILFCTRILGGLMVTSANESFFTPARLSVVEDYAHLLACIFESEEFFDFDDIQLGIMPSYAYQQPYLSGYNERVLRKLVEANRVGQQLAVQQAHLLVWQDLEDLLLQVRLEETFSL